MLPAIYILTALILSLLGCVAWKLTARITEKTMRLWARVAAFIALIAPVGPGVLLLVGPAFAEGDYVCLTCGQRAMRVTCMSATIWSGPSNVDERVLPHPKPHARTYADLVGADRAHHWFPVGCTSTFSGVACSEVPRGFWFDELPDLPDERLAHALADKFRSLTVREQHGLLCESDMTIYGEKESSPAFRTWLDHWRVGHVDWP